MVVTFNSRVNQNSPKIKTIFEMKQEKIITIAPQRQTTYIPTTANNIFRRQRIAPTGTRLQQKHARHQHRAPRRRQPPRPHSVKHGPRLHPAAVRHEEVQTEDPADVRVAVPAQLVRAEVGLEGADGVHEAEGAHPGAEAAEEREVGSPSAFGERFRGWGRGEGVRLGFFAGAGEGWGREGKGRHGRSCRAAFHCRWP